LQTAESLGLKMPATSFVKSVIEDIYYNKI